MTKKGKTYFANSQEQVLLNGVSGLPRDALQLLFRMEKNSAEEKMLQAQDQGLKRLRKQYGDFDESSLVFFLVKYLLKQKQEGIETSPELPKTADPKGTP